MQALKVRGATEIFGLPGDFALPMFREFERSGLLPVHTLSHEPSVGFAADAAARTRGGLGVAAVTYGAGAFNLINAAAAAYAERVPLVVLSGAPAAREAASGYLLHHQVKTLDSQWRVFQEFTVDSARLDDPARAPHLIARVLDAALDRARPVYLEIPRDMPALPCADVPPRAARVVDAERLAACADELLHRLSEAARPVLMVGVEARRYGLEAKVAQLAHRLAIPVVTNIMGQGLMADEDLAVVGTYLGLAGDPKVTELVETADALLLLGVIISDTNFAVSARRIDFRRAIHAFDGDVAMGHHVYHRVPLESLIDALVQRLAPAAGRTPPPQTVPAPAPIAPQPDTGTIAPHDIAAAVNELMRTHGTLPISCDVGDCLFTALEIDRTALIAPGYYAGMGYAVPAALGLQVATGRRPLVLVGDGAFEMTGWELGNAQRCGCDPIVVIFNNAGWEMLRAFEPRSRLNDLARWDFASMAAGMGGDGYRISNRTELRNALDRAYATRGRFQLIDVQLERGALSPTLRRFVDAFQRASGSAAR